MSALIPLLAAVLLAEQPYRVRQPFPSLTVPEGLGVNAHFQTPSFDELMRVRSAGFRWVRTDLKWETIETSRGVYDFSKPDALIAQMAKAGLRLWWILDYENPLYGQGPPIGGEAKEAFLRFAHAAAERYTHRGVIWEVWNEPDIEQFWHALPDPYAYVGLAKGATTAIRSVAKDEYVVGPAASGFDWGYLSRCLEAGLLDSVDAVTVHPYRQQDPESVTRDYRRLQGMIRWHKPGSPPPVLCGEWGYGIGKQTADESTQAQALMRAYLTNLGAGVPLTILYNWTDSGAAPGETFVPYGFTSDGVRTKVTYTAMKRLTDALAGARFESVVPSAVGAKLLRFRRGSRELVVGWAVDTPVEISWAESSFRLDTVPTVLPP